METQQILDLYKPILYLHQGETSFPISMETLIKNSSLIENAIVTKNKEGNTIVVGGETTIPSGQVTNEKLYDISKTKYNGETGLKTLYLQWPERFNKGVSPVELDTVPIYGRVIDRDSYYEVNYIFNFPYNPPFNVLKIQKAGQHYGDLEHITMFIRKPITGKVEDIIKVMYGGHGKLDGRWVDFKDLPIKDNKVVVYVAKGSHALYPSKGLILRFGGVANDETSDDYKWEAKSIIPIYNESNPNFNKQTMGWIYFAGRFGNDGITSLADKYWWISGEPTPEIMPLSPPQILTGFQVGFYRLIQISILLGISYGIYFFGLYQTKISIKNYYILFSIIMVFLAIITRRIIRKVS